jgi:FAD/FMN-containing dehydrogenase/Fe-S oxidoreductase
MTQIDDHRSDAIPHESPPPEVDTEALASELTAAVRGEVRFDDGARALYATDASNYRQIPIGVVVPRDGADVEAAVAVCRRHGAPIVARGGGTSLGGQGCNVAVVVDMSKYMREVVELDPDNRLATVEPGCVLDTLRDAAGEHGLTFGPDPATHNHCVLGGMIGNNSCGVHSVTAGRTSDNIESLDVVTYDGTRMTVGATSDEEYERIVAEGGRRAEIYRALRALRDRYADEIRERYPQIPRRVSGYNLDELLPENGFNVARALVGTESTCVLVLEATTRLIESPPCSVLTVLGFDDIAAAGEAVTAVLEHDPFAVEAVDRHLCELEASRGIHPEAIAELPRGAAWLLVELGADETEEARARGQRLVDALVGGEAGAVSGEVVDDEELAGKLWQVREAGLGATARTETGDLTWPGWEDSAVPPERLGDYLRGLRGLYDKYGYDAAIYGHFGDGCVHTRIDFEMHTREGLDTFRAFMAEAADVVLSHGGSLSGEHGDGQARAEFLDKMYGPELVQAFREFKAIWDPAGKMNPGKVVDPYRIDENLRLGTDYRPVPVRTVFSYPEDRGDFTLTSLRCVGVGECRKTDDGTMCPSYMVTREEKHSTRGRARLLFEMLQGDAITDGWRSTEVLDALDLCLACKACKTECPVNVDMATYKAEFYAHHYRRRLRPRHAFALGLIYWAARVGARVPRLANLALSAPGLSYVTKAIGGVTRRRPAPRFAHRTFRDSFRQSPIGGRRVLLWTDTFNNHFSPGVLDATATTLTAAGFSVEIPRRPLCCGRPLYDFGMLRLARHQLVQILEALRPAIRAGVPVIVAEPSCLSVLRDELVNMLPQDADARRLASQCFTLAQFLDRNADSLDWPSAEGRIVLHGHCHQKSLFGMEEDVRALRRIGYDVEMLDDGCCGLAGSFGYDDDHYDVSMAAGERRLFPAVREAADQTRIVSDGFSCTSQIEHGTSRETHHLAEVLAEAWRGPTHNGG